jgi:prepilin-type N-terminal cleavage/methylation domain-containing protein
MRPKLNRSRNRGLTIIELVVVVAVLAILAGFIVPRLGFVRNLASESGNATIIADSASQAVFYNTAVGHYPQGEDLLVDTAGNLYSNLNASLSTVLSPIAFNSDGNVAKSILGQLDPYGTSAVLYANREGVSNPNNSGQDQVTLTKTSTQPIAQVTIPASTGSVSYPIYTAAYGEGALGTNGAPLDGTFLVAFGYGPNSQINGKTGLEPPVLFDKIPGEYNRPILLLKVFPTGSTAGNGIVPAGTNAATSISLGYDASTANTQLAKYAVDVNR